MKSIESSKQKIRIAIINFKDVCNIFAQNGIVSTAIADEMLESLSKEQIEQIIHHLTKKI